MLVSIIVGVCWTGYIQWKIHSVSATTLSEPVDVGIVLGASLWDNRPSPALKERLDHGLRLYRQGLFDTFIVTGGMDGNGSTIPEGEGMKRYLIAQGVPPADIFVEDKARSTYENLLFSQKIMKEKGFQKAVIVTHVYHGARALDIARFTGYDYPQISLTESRVMFMPWHKFRETLAYTNWLRQKWMIRFGMID
ncbi:MAG: YdcF family protein [Bacillaceae bacterium]|nr:YdcF family protein [Bacillaceae bacterium]